MASPAAKQGDRIQAMDHHVVLVPSATGTTPVTQTLPFNGIIDGALCQSVKVQGRSAAVVGSVATNTPHHVPMGGTFAVEPSNKGLIVTGSATVFFGGHPAARSSDLAVTCNDPPAPLPTGTVVAESTVLIGG
ncbi:hypothetical protein D7V97_30185 [Corallococcus sp. CA053C]|uniref:PAAR domain-containing protein n=1 Tax=Corallococcus sp. CA053C TaxID=2316732 RepID=UPI000EA30CC6|nr:PAAR domain-containing protein [Corallococcus sp. CA053C]RKH00548.1 hypothetical protein D7V97_30185 [Corallococcus sp. CA053C]